MLGPGIDIPCAWPDTASVNLSITKRQTQYIKAKVSSGHYGSASEVVREAIRVLEELETDRDHLEMLLDEADLEPAIPGGKAFWKKLRGELRSPAKRSAA